MFWEVRARLIFSEEDEAKDFYHDCEIALPKATVLNPLTPYQELSETQLVENHHDSDPNDPCIELEHADNGIPPV